MTSKFIFSQEMAQSHEWLKKGDENAAPASVLARLTAWQGDEKRRKPAAKRWTATKAFFIADLSHLARDVKKAFTRPSFPEIEGIVTS